ncbi:DUF3667 domain-containing protein [Sphingomicrobium clamense]|uniref:DUF3667 domain-containing protein n=1 Tax=Sphingomicrobium clamense TaxID=2851013 RepID=A0ABS6V469_9SPHN|nr:DUF3667 domain-containing protein [Sphingomicrobium sp. B8]MBW0144296.1 DUF3667 domain-containing protein [Sphingomicrobium sp. B8]
MSIEGAGEVVGGALAGRAVEPVPDGEGGEKVPGPGDCLNCATPVEGQTYCHHCGQKVKVHRTLRGLFNDFIHGILHFDGKFWRTLPMLFTAPGELTRRYVKGQRARFISPIAVYLFAVVAMFAFVISVGDIDPDDVQINTPKAQTVEEQQEIIQGLEEALAELNTQDFPGVSGAKAGVQSELRDAREHLQTLREADPDYVPEPNVGPNVTTSEDGTGPMQISFGETDWDVLQQQIDKAQKNPGLYLYKVQTKAYKLSWLLIPMSLPFMFLLLPFSRKFKMYDHAVFVTYSISFMMLLVLAIAGLAAIFGAGDWIAWALLVPPIHMYRQLRGAYRLGRLSALFRTFLLSIFAVITLALFAGLMLGLGVL